MSSQKLMSNAECLADDPDMDMLPEYDFDYSKAKPNRFAKSQSGITVVLDADVAAMFKTSEAVNKALRAILAAIPRQ